MDFKKFLGIFKDLKNGKNFGNVLIILLVVVFLWLATGSFLSGDNKTEKTDPPKGAQEVVSDDDLFLAEKLDYEEKQEEEVKNILKKIKGVGDVDVVINFKTGEVKVPAVNTTTQNSETKEEDTSGGTRTTYQEQDGNTIVMTGDGADDEPFIVKTYKPEINGVIIVAEGAENNKLKYDIQVAVANLYNLSLNKVNVYPMNN